MSWLAVCPVLFFAQNTFNKADSIITEALNCRDAHAKYIREYDAQVYIKGTTFVMKKNRLFKYAPGFLLWDKKRNHSFTEAIVDVHYTSPNHFTQEFKALNGNKLNAEEIQQKVMQFLNANMYNSAIFNNQVLLPGAKDVFRYYRFDYVSSLDTLGKTVHQIRIIPKIQSQKLISGYFYIMDGIWSVFKMDIQGEWEFSKFRVQTEFGWERNDFMLPQNTTIEFYTNLLGNELTSRYFAGFHYSQVKMDDGKKDDSSGRYDLSEYFNLRSDSIPIVKDPVFWRENRPVPLSSQEIAALQSNHPAEKQPDSLSRPFSWDFARGFISPRKFNYSDTQFTYSGLLNPLKLAYSKLDGVLYWQQLRLYKQNARGQEIQFNPNLGILFQRKEIYFSLPASWVFDPRKFGEVYFGLGNRNQSYNSTIINQINQRTPASINFDDFDLEYYRHFYTELESSYELVNGLIMSAGIHSDWYIPVKKADAQAPPLKSPAIDDDLVDLVENMYRNFTPVIGLRWTPCQYYRFVGKRKEYVKSHFPTFSLEYARGIKGILQSNSSYERIEADMQQKIPLGLMRSFHYYIGAGCFTNTESVYFADFNNFQWCNIPRSWNDPIGGTFHLLSGDWYNASNTYLQAHFMYESPFSILQFFRWVAKDILQDRFYVSQLYTPALPCYTELGYGFGNFLANAGVFASFIKGRYESIGVKFAFELGH